MLCRLFAIQNDPREAGVQSRLWKLAEEILPQDRPGDFNQALMELGATVCLPRTPQCLLCPVRGSCRAHHRGIQEQLPVRSERKPIPHHQTLVALIQKGPDLLMGPRPNEGLLGGLWSFPEFEFKKWGSASQSRQEIQRRTGIKTELLRPLTPVVHTFSHKRVTYLPHLFQCVSQRKAPIEPWRWIPSERIADYPLPKAVRKIFDQLTRADRLPLAAETQETYRTALE